MPSGLYSHHDPHDGTLVAYERFSCAPGPSGWRYVAEVLGPDAATAAGAVDVTVQIVPGQAAPGQGMPERSVPGRIWRLLRVEVRDGGWIVRGGVAAGEVMWIRTGQGVQQGPAERGQERQGPVRERSVRERSVRASSFAGRSPVFSIVTARVLALPEGGTARVRLVELTEPVLAARTIDEAWAFSGTEEHRTPTGALIVERYEVADLATGTPRVLHLAGDVLLAAPGVELEELDGPPWLAAAPGAAG